MKTSQVDKMETGLDTGLGSPLPPPVRTDDDLVDDLNRNLAALGRPADWASLPDVHSRTKAALDGKRIVVVDDRAEALADYLPYLFAATTGSAAAVHHKGGPASELAREILSRQPDVVLLDWGLAAGLTGKDVFSELPEPKPVVIGFSAEQKHNEHFKQLGIRTIQKLGSPHAALMGIALVVQTSGRS